MKRALLLCIVAFACGSAAGAQTPGGMQAMQYFVGTWECSGGPVGVSPFNMTVTFDKIDSGIMRERDTVHIPGQTSPYTASKSVTYDAKNDRWVQTQLDDQGAWTVSYLKPWTGDTEEWVDQATSEGKPGRSETVRTNATSFAFYGYANPADTKPDFAGKCTRT
jgi:hypothetical protein